MSISDHPCFLILSCKINKGTETMFYFAVSVCLVFWDSTGESLYINDKCTLQKQFDIYYCFNCFYYCYYCFNKMEMKVWRNYPVFVFNKFSMNIKNSWASCCMPTGNWSVATENVEKMKTSVWNMQISEIPQINAYMAPQAVSMYLISNIQRFHREKPTCLLRQYQYA